MMDIDFYKRQYTGKGINIAIIDTGINIELHSANKNAQKVDTSGTRQEYSHGTLCALKLLGTAPGVNIIDINVTNIEGKITEDSVLKALEYSLTQEIDIIHLSLGFTTNSKKLYDLCKKATEQDVLVIAAASHNGEVIYPADFDCVIKVQFSNQQDSDIVALNKYTFSLTDRFLEYHRNNHAGRVSGTSITAAYFSGICALLIEAKPFMKRQDAVQWLYDNSNKLENKRLCESTSIYNEIMDTKGIVAILNDTVKYIQFHDLMKQSIIGYYDFIKEKAFGFNGQELEDSQYDTIYFINPSTINRESSFPQTIEKKNKVFIGNFNGNQNLVSFKKHISRNHKPKPTQTPLVLITGYGNDCSKFYTQLLLSKHLTDNTLSFKNITYNPLGYIFGMDVYEYPNKINYPDIVHSINHSINKIDESQDYELIIANIGGGIKDLSSENSNNYGALTNAYILATQIDIVILCVNTIISPPIITQEVVNLKSRGIPEVAIVVSDQTYNINTLENPSGISAYPVCKTKQLDYTQNLKNVTNDSCKVFTIDEVINKALYKHIFNILS